MTKENLKIFIHLPVKVYCIVTWDELEIVYKHSLMYKVYHSNANEPVTHVFVLSI